MTAGCHRQFFFILERAVLQTALFKDFIPPLARSLRNASGVLSSTGSADSPSRCLCATRRAFWHAAHICSGTPAAPGVAAVPTDAPQTPCTRRRKQLQYRHYGKQHNIILAIRTVRRRWRGSTFFCGVFFRQLYHCGKRPLYIPHYKQCDSNPQPHRLVARWRRLNHGIPYERPL